jgi:hypothetical protein
MQVAKEERKISCKRYEKIDAFMFNLQERGFLP